MKSADQKQNPANMMATRPMLSLALLLAVASAIPSQPLFFRSQVVDHFSTNSALFSQRYYMNDTFFQGPGSPILVIMGGEGAIEPSTGIYYPYVVDLAQQFGGMVIEPEHRFYGQSQPQPPYDTQKLSLLTPQQALEDAVTLIVAIQKQRNCSSTDDTRCPVVTFGGSYPGWLSAMMRIRYPGVVDFAYSASAPMLFYTQQVDQSSYYSVVTQSAERALPGCSDAVLSSLQKTIGALPPKQFMIDNLGLCEPLPDYLEQGDAALLRDEIAMIVQYSFANLNMANYPPGNTTSLYAACAAWQQNAAAPWAAIRQFLHSYSVAALGSFRRHQFNARQLGVSGCYNMSAQLPSGPHATISAGDWSGVGTGNDGANWDFETCNFLVEAIGTNGQTDMFLPRNWTIDWLTQHCQSRFGVTPQPRLLADLWGFDQLDHLGATHIVFTNGLNDGWSVGGVRTAIRSQEIYVFDLPNGAHHSDLAHVEPSDADTEDVQAVHREFTALLQRWLGELDLKRQQ